MVEEGDNYFKPFHTVLLFTEETFDNILSLWDAEELTEYEDMEILNIEKIGIDKKTGMCEVMFSLRAKTNDDDYVWIEEEEEEEEEIVVVGLPLGPPPTKKNKSKKRR